jgi:hypothetical protein
VKRSRRSDDVDTWNSANEREFWTVTLAVWQVIAEHEQHYAQRKLARLRDQKQQRSHVRVREESMYLPGEPKDAEDKRKLGAAAIGTLYARDAEEARLKPSLSIITRAQLVRDAEELHLSLNVS